MSKGNIGKGTIRILWNLLTIKQGLIIQQQITH